MEHYDIVQIDDDPAIRNLTRRIVEGRGLTHFGVGSLQALEEALGSASAAIFVVDGEFPEVDNGRPAFLAPRAIDLIRSAYGEGVKIVLYSGAGGKAQEAAEQKGVHYLYKGGDLFKDMDPIIEFMNR